MNKWLGIQEFVTTVDLSSMSKAANILRTTKSSVSKRITALEHRLGVMLIHRSNRTICLTTEGQLYYERSRQLLKQLDDNDEHLKEQHSELYGKLTLSLPPGINETLIIPVITKFKERHSQVEFNLHFSNRRVDMVQERFDVALRLAKTIEPNLIAKKLCTRPYHLCATEKYLSTHSEPKHPLDLQSMNCLVFTEFAHSNTVTWSFKNKYSGEKVVITPLANITSNTVSSLVNASMLNTGIVYCSEFFVGSHIMSNSLRSIMKNWICEEQTLWAVFPNRNALSRRARAFIDFVDNISLDDTALTNVCN